MRRPPKLTVFSGMGKSQFSWGQLTDFQPTSCMCLALSKIRLGETDLWDEIVFPGRAHPVNRRDPL
jgi:hypothetical protein